MKRIIESTVPLGAFCKKCKQPIKDSICYFDKSDERYWHIECIPDSLLKEEIEKSFMSLTIITTTYPIKCAVTCKNRTIETGKKAAYEKEYARYYHLDCVPFEFRRFIEGLK